MIWTGSKNDLTSLHSESTKSSSTASFSTNWKRRRRKTQKSGHDSGVDGQWESFSGWSTEVARNQARHSGRASRVTPTELSFASDKVEVSPISSSKSIDMSSMDSPKSVELLPSEWVDDPGYILDLESDDDTDAESDCDFESEQAVQYEFAEESEYDSSSSE